EVHPSSVTKMIQKLDKDEYVHYEKYRGFVLTDKGNKVGKRLVFRHDLLEDFLEIIGVDEEKIYNDVEGIEHHLSWNAIDRIADVVEYFNEDKARLTRLQAITSTNEARTVKRSRTKMNSDCVFSGGGIKAYALLGSVKSINDKKYRIQRVAGT